MKARLERQVAIRRIVTENKVTGQEQLLMLLKHEGFDMTQATLSRDLKALKIAKSPDPQGKYVYVLPGGASGKENSSQSGVNFLADGFLSIDFSLNMAVIKTKPAYASSIAAIIDSANPYEFLGTIAGDDTIFMVMREGVERTDVFTFLENVMPNLKGRLI
ncbi:MAG: ArgR family transcriptional regulator [Prolixibacteraceae bacterium]|nr:ArgR family transcriptional regulator [Prolixibacteraceae bacterium]